jgi:ribonucleoside-diphosphate reductase beta chain
MDELWPDAYGVIEYLTTLYDIQVSQDWVRTRFDFDSNIMREYAKRQFEIRKNQVDRARKYADAVQLDQEWTTEV